MEQAGSDAVEYESLLTQATSLFHSKDFDKCEEFLNNILNLKPCHSKTLMNKALLEYVGKRHYTHTDDYTNELKRIASLEDVQLTSHGCSSTRTSCEQSSVLEPNGSAACSVSAFSLTINDSASFLPQSTLALSLKYNYALVLFYQQQYVQAEHVLSTCLGLQACVKPSEKGSSGAVDHLSHAPTTTDLPTVNLTPTSDLLLCRRILLLWLESLFHLQQSERVFHLCAAWLTVLSSMTLTNSLNSIHLNTTDRSIPTTSRYMNSQTCTMLQGIHKPIKLFYIRACLLTGRLNAAEDELNHMTNEKDTPDLHAEEDVEVPYCNESDKQCDDNRSLAEKHPQIPEDCWRTGRAVHFLLAQLFFLKGNHAEAINRLSGMPPPPQGSLATDQCENALWRNNLALVLHRTGQYNFSGLQLRRALREMNNTLSDALSSSVSCQSGGSLNENSATQFVSYDSSVVGQVPLHVFSLDRRNVLLHNHALQLLFAHKPNAAFPVLLRLASTYPRNPRLWLRLAECCIKIHRPNNLSWWHLESRSRCIVKAIGVGPCRKLLFKTTDEEKPIHCTESPSEPRPTLEFASLCLRNATLLIPRPPSDLGTTDGTKLLSRDERRNALLKWAELQTVPVYPSPVPLRGIGLLHVLCAVHLATAYVSLCLDDPVITLHSAGRLIPDFCVPLPSTAVNCTGQADEGGGSAGNVQSVSPPSRDTVLGLVAPPAYRFLARLYYAEALAHLDRVSEAIGLLKSFLPSSLTYARQVEHLYASSPSLDPIYLRPETTVERSTNTSVSAENTGTLPGKLAIYPPDFPSTSSQAAGLFFYNLAAIVAIDKQWGTSEDYLTVASRGLSISVQELSGRNWIPIPTSPNQPVPFLHPPVVLPLPFILLQLYLSVALDRPDQTLAILRDTFGHAALAGRLNPPFTPSSFSASSKAQITAETDRSWTLSDLHNLLKSSSPMDQASSKGPQLRPQRPENMWAPAQHFKHLSPSAFSGVNNPSLLQAHYASGRPDYPSTTQQHPSGIITAANENDWPPL